MPCEVKLSSEEMKQAAGVAKELHDKLRKFGVKDAHGLRKADATAEMEAGGAQAELAVSKHYGVPWSASLPGHKTTGPDVGKRTQVRSSNKPRREHHLMIRPRDIEKYDDVPFVLVIQNGNTFEIKGWIMAYEGIKKGRLWDGGDPNRPAVWFVHESILNAPETLSKEDM